MEITAHIIATLEVIAEREFAWVMTEGCCTGLTRIVDIDGTNVRVKVRRRSPERGGTFYLRTFIGDQIVYINGDRFGKVTSTNLREKRARRSRRRRGIPSKARINKGA